MKLRRIYRCVLLVLVGGLVLQTTTTACCPTQVAEVAGAAFVAAAAPAIASAITNSLQTGTGAKLRPRRRRVPF